MDHRMTQPAPTRDRRGLAPSERDELRDIFALAELGTGSGFEWLFEHLEKSEGRNK